MDDYLYTNEHLPDGRGRSVFAGPNREKLMSGLPPAGADIAVEWERMIHPDDWHEHLAYRVRLHAGEPSEVRYRMVGYDGITRWVHGRAQLAQLEGRVFVDGIVSDVTRQVEAEEELRRTRRELERLLAVNQFNAAHDALTGLGNRLKLLGALESAIASEEPWLLALFDLDGFKSYNDTFGHPAGDALLVRLSSRLRDAMPPDATFRFGGDEFLVLARESGDVGEQLTLAAAALVEECEGFSIGASFGAVLIPTEVGTAEDALRLCDQRLYNEKHHRQERRGRPQDVLLEALNAREASLEDHSEDVADLAAAVAMGLGLSAVVIETVRQAALLHDIGKIGIPDSVLVKPGPLDEQEWDLMRRRTIIGERILAASPTLAEIASIVRSTHERLDGAGYPDGLAGSEIRIEARIVAVCDSFSAMTSDRSYRRSLTTAQALAELRRCAGTQFDPAVVASLSRHLAACEPATAIV